MLPLLFDQAQQLADYAREALGRLSGTAPAKTDDASPEEAGRQGARFDPEASRLRLSSALRGLEAPRRAEDKDEAGRGSASLNGALAAAVAQLRRDAVAAFEALGMDRSLAEQAGKALAGATRAATGTTSFQAQLSSLTASEKTRVSNDGFYYGASMALQQVEIAYDEASGSFSATVIQVSVSLEVASGSMIERLDPLVLDLLGRESDLREATSGLFFDPEAARPPADPFTPSDDPGPDMTALLLIESAERAEDAAAGDEAERPWPARLRLQAVLPLLLPRDAVAHDPALAPVDLTA